jgi:transposase
MKDVVIALRKQGKSVYDIEKETKVERTTVENWIDSAKRNKGNTPQTSLVPDGLDLRINKKARDEIGKKLE